MHKESPGASLRKSRFIKSLNNGEGFLPQYFYNLEKSQARSCQDIINQKIDWDELKFQTIFFNLIQEFVTSNFFFLSYGFYQGGFIYSNAFLLASYILTAYPMVALINLKRITNLTLRELMYLQFGFIGLKFMDVCVFFIHFSDIYSYIQAFSIMISKFLNFFGYSITYNQSFWVQLLFFYPIVSIPRLVRNQKLRSFCDLLMFLGFMLTFYFDIRAIFQLTEINLVPLLIGANRVESAMQIFSTFEESIAIYEIYRDQFTEEQTQIFKKYTCLAHFCIFILSFLLGNLTLIAFGNNVQKNIMDQFDNQQYLVIFGQLFYVFAAITSYAQLFAPIDLLYKDQLDLYKESNKLAIFKLNNLSKFQIQDMVKINEINQITWFKLCYYHSQSVDEEMQKINKDTKNVSNNKYVLLNVFKFITVVLSIYFGLLTTKEANLIFNFIQIFFKTPVSVIFPCLLNLIYCNLSKMEQLLNVFFIIFGIFLTGLVFNY